MAHETTVAHILPWPTLGGIEIATLRISEAVRDHGIRNVAFCPAPEGPLIEAFTSKGFDVAVYSPVEPSYRRPRPYLYNSWRLSRELKRRRVQVVHCSDILGAYYGALGARLARLPVLSHVRNRYDVISRRDRSFLSLVNYFAFVSQHTWTHFGYHVPPERGAVLYDGVCPPEDRDEAADRTSVRAEFGLPASSRIVGMVARVAPQKDYFTLVRAAAAVVKTRPDVRFMIVGDTSSAESYRAHYEEVRRMIDAAGLGQHILFTGFRSDVQRFLNAFDIFVLSTHMEGLPLVILEAMAYGVPVVATAIDGVPEVISDGITGMVYAHEDAHGLADKISILLDDSGLATALGVAGQQRVYAEFSWKSFGSNAAAIYRKLAP